MDPAPSSRVRRSPEVRRAEIITAATEVFGRSGYRDGSLKDVADAVALTVQGVLHYFPSKEELLMEVLQQRVTERQTESRDILEQEGAIAYLGHFVKANQADPDFMRLFVTLSAESTDPAHPAHEYFRHRYEQAAAALTAMLDADRTAGRVRSAINPAIWGPVLVALADGLQLQRLHAPDLNIADLWDDATAMLKVARPGDDGGSQSCEG